MDVIALVRCVSSFFTNTVFGKDSAGSMSNRPYADPFNDRNPSDHSDVPPQRIALNDDQFSPFPSSSSVNLNGGQTTPYDYPPSSFSHSNLGAYPPSNPGQSAVNFTHRLTIYSDEDSEAKMPLTADNRMQAYNPGGCVSAVILAPTYVAQL